MPLQNAPDISSCEKTQSTDSALLLALGAWEYVKRRPCFSQCDWGEMQNVSPVENPFMLPKDNGVCVVSFLAWTDCTNDISYVRKRTKCNSKFKLSCLEKFRDLSRRMLSFFFCFFFFYFYFLIGVLLYNILLFSAVSFCCTTK